jgi:MFS family permease
MTDGVNLERRPPGRESGPTMALIFGAAFLRSVGVGLTGVLLGLYLSHLGFSPSALGFVVAAGLAGVVVAQLLVTLGGDRFGRRRSLVTLALLTGAGGLGLAFARTGPVVFAAAFGGMVNGIGRDRGAASVLEQAILPGTVPDSRRTWCLAQYNVVLDAGHALGALCAGLPLWLQHAFTVGPVGAYRLTFVAYGALGCVGALLCRALPGSIEVGRAALPPARSGSELSPGSRAKVAKLAALLGLDSLGGGFLGGSLLAYWFFRRYGLREDSLALLFFVSRLLNAASHLAAAWLARRVGLLNTMVFTHIPSSLSLLAVPFAPSLGWAVALFLVRESLVEMDVPTRQSYVAAVVRPEERTRASGVTNLVRNVGWALGPSLAGASMQHVLLASPLLLGAGIKIVYDALLYASFRHVAPPEERGPGPGGNSDRVDSQAV